jgi:hypothetical protein
MKQFFHPVFFLKKQVLYLQPLNELPFYLLINYCLLSIAYCLFANCLLLIAYLPIAY